MGRGSLGRVLLLHVSSHLVPLLLARVIPSCFFTFARIIPTLVFLLSNFNQGGDSKSSVSVSAPPFYIYPNYDKPGCIVGIDVGTSEAMECCGNQ